MPNTTDESIDLLHEIGKLYIEGVARQRLIATLSARNKELERVAARLDVIEKALVASDSQEGDGLGDGTIYSDVD